MKKVRRENTAAELAVRRFLHAAGLRYCLHVRGLPGSPDLVLPKRRSVVFVHGCFWHGHHCAHGRVKAKSNAEYWVDKIEANRDRDRRQRRVLRAAGWHVETIWECQIERVSVLQALAARLMAR